MIPPSFEVRDPTESEDFNTVNNMPTSWLESFGSSFELARQNAPTLSLKRAYNRVSDQYDAEQTGAELVSLAEANKELAPLGLVVFKDEPRSYIDALKEKHLDDARLASSIQRGPQNVLAGASYFISGIGGTQTDFINFGANFVPIVGQYKFLNNIAKQGLFRARLAKGLKESFVGNLAIEPLDHALAKAEQRQYSLSDSFTNIFVGTLAGAGLHLTFSKVADFYKAKTGKENIYKDIAEAPVEFREDLIKYSIGRMMSGRKINAAEFIEHTKLKSNREMKLQDWINIQAKSSFQTSYDLDTKLNLKDPKEIPNIKEEIKTRIEAKLSPEQTKEIKKIRKQLTTLNKKFGQTIEQKSKDADIDLIKKDKNLIPIIAKINKLNKLEEKIIERGEDNAIREMIQMDNSRKKGDFSTSKSTLNKLNELQDIYNKRTPIQTKEIMDRASSVDINSPSKTNLITKEKVDGSNIQMDPRFKQSAEYELNTNDMIIPMREIDRTTKLNVEDIKQINDSIDDIKSQLEIKDAELRQDPAISEFLDDFNKEIADLDKITNRQKDFFKAIQAGFSCVLRGR
jgi:hypothetical protein